MTDIEEQPTTASDGRRISKAIVGIVRDALGRGPENCRVYVHRDAIFVLLHGALSRTERAAVDGGHVQEVLALRQALQTVLRPAMVEAIEEITGRTVSTFMSTNSATPDHAAEIFLLADADVPDPVG